MEITWLRGEGLWPLWWEEVEREGHSGLGAGKVLGRCEQDPQPRSTSAGSLCLSVTLSRPAGDLTRPPTTQGTLGN